MSNNRRFIFRVFVVFFAAALIYVFLGNDAATQNAQEQPERNTFKEFETPDAVTRLIHDKTKSFAIVKINNESERDTIYKLGNVVEDYGSFVLAASDKSQKFADSDLDSQALDTTINLPNGKFEPITEQFSQAVGTDLQKGDASGKNYYIVQFGGIAKDKWLESLREVGAEVVQYVPHQAFIIYADGDAISKISGHSRVRWVGKYAAEQKISPELNEFTARLEDKTAMFDVAVFARADLDVVSSEFINITNGQIKSQIKLSTNFFNILRIEAPISELAKIAGIPDVFRIDPYTKPVIEDERAAQIVAGNLFSRNELLPPGYDPLLQFGYDGTNVTVAVVDDGISIPAEGFYITSSNATNGPLRGAALGATSGHGHFNASIIAGSAPFSALDPLGYNYGIGIAPKANVTNIPFTKAGYTGNDAQTVDDAFNTEGPNGVKGYIANNSWGNGANGNSYDAFASMYDGFVRDASLAASFDPVTLIFSAGNCGNAPPGPACANQNGLTRPKVAKNIITVGNSENIRTEISASANNADDLASSSSRGPTADGRVKPDIVAPGTIITGSRAGNGGGLDGGQIDAHHYYSSGTSHSAPQVAGAAALFTEFWKISHGGVNPSPAMTKAAIISSAQEMNGVNSAGAIPNGNEGWGRINLKYMFNTGAPMKYVDQETVFAAAGDNTTIEGTVGNSSKPVRVSLVWTDPPAVADPALVNNLDLTVTIGNNIYKGNVFSGGNSVTGGSADTINNVENVFLPAGIPAGTPFKIEVIAKSINADGRVGNADSTDQHFALIAYNYSSCIYAISSAFQSVPASGGSVSVNVTTPGFCSWTTTNNLGWVTVTSGSTGTGNGAVILSVQPNSGGLRSGSVKIAGRDFTLEQQGSTVSCSYALSPTSANIAGAGSSGSFSITTQTGCNWTAASNAPWISITSGNNGSGSGTITFTAQPNTNAARTGTITAGGQTFTINQSSGCSYSLSANSASFSETGGNGSVNVNSDLGCAWTAVSNVSWITVTNGSNGAGNGTVAFSVAASNGLPRSGTITIAGQTFTVNQASGCSYAVPPNSANLSSGGATVSFAVNAGAGCAWTAVSNVSWITITSGSGSGNGVVTFSVTPNTGAARTGTITVANQTFTVNQAAGCIYTLSSVSANSPANGLTGSVNVIANTGCAWTAQSNVPWITVTSGSTGNGNGTVIFSVAANSGVARTGTITIAGQTFTVNQTPGGVVAPRRSQFDFDGDNKTDLSIFRPAVGEWWYLKSSHVGNSTFQFGTNTDKLIPADYTGDGKTDIAFFRPASGEWFILRSEDNSFFSFPFGANGDVPAPADYDGDGKADPAIFRASSTTWFISLSSGGTTIQQFGISGDVPVTADYDGDGKSDIAIYRPSLGQWWLSRSTGGTIVYQFGVSTDKLVQGDYTGDGKTDVAFFRPSTNEWFVLRSENNSFYSFPFGASGDIPSPGDYDGDGKADATVFRPSNNTWFVQQSGAGTLIQTFGISGDKPVPAAFVP